MSSPPWLSTSGPHASNQRLGGVQSAGSTTPFVFSFITPCDTKPRTMDVAVREYVSMPQARSQREIARDLLAARGVLRLAELRAAGGTAATVSRMEKDSEVIRLARGLYQLPDPALYANPTLRPEESPVRTR